jgi:hypothetical protein
MNRFRRTATVIAGLIFSVVAVCVAAPTAFAMRVVEPGTASGPLPSSYVVTRGGMVGWEIAVIAVCAALVAAVLTAIASRIRFRASAQPAAS